MKCELGTICTYRKGKIEVSKLNQTTYISTENMLPNKGGIVSSSNLPNTLTTQEFQPNDILVSNIRPYFKKIWLARYCGGCSNDVLVFTANKDVDPIFLYYVLSDDTFFSYATATAKGTKMPRGDRAAIMQYSVPNYNLSTQKKIGAVLQSLDEKIETNNAISENFKEQAQLLFSKHFGHISCNNLPEGWHTIKLDEVAIICKDSFNPAKEPQTLLEHYSLPAFDETRFPVFEPSSNVKSSKFKIDADCFMISKLNPTTKRVWKPYCLSGHAVCSTEFIVYKAKNRRYTDFLYSLIDSDDFSAFMCSHVTGSTGSRQMTTPSDTLQYTFAMPPQTDIDAFTALVHPMYEQIRINAIENDKLKKLRDSILPKLISGELDVSNLLTVDG